MPRERSVRRTRFVVAMLVGVVLTPILAAPAAASSSLLPYSIIAVPSQADAVRIGDVTGDGLADIVFTTEYDNDPANDFDLFVLPQVAGGFGPFAHYVTAGVYTDRPESLDIGDVTGDGLADVVVGLDRTGIQVFPALADGTLGSPTFIASNDSTRVAVGDLVSGGGLDVAGIGWGSNTVTVFSGGPSGLTATATYPAQHGGYDDLEIADVSGDGRDDLVVMSGQGQAESFSVLAQLAGGGFDAAAEYSVGTGPFTLTHGIGLGDVTGDGRNDVVVSYGGNKPNSYVAVFPQTAGGTLGAPIAYASYDIPEPVEVADLDFDGRNEVVTVHGGWQKVGVYGGLSDGTLAAETLYGVPYASHYNPQGLAIGDLNGDGAPDIIEADYNYGLIVLLNGLSGPAPTVPGAPSLTTAVVGDGSVALGWNAPVSNGGAEIASYTARATPGGSTCTTTSLGCAIGGLTNGVQYSFTVYATNSVGSGPESNALSATPRTAPSAPRNVTAKAGGTGIKVTWATPTSNGGAAITAYQIYRGASASTGSLIATVSAGATSFVDTSAPRKVTSFYWVTAVNPAGESPRSNVVSAIGK
jgi:hypothetical protein